MIISQINGKGMTLKLPKKGNLKECKNWRGITLLSVVGKILGRIVIDRIRNGVDIRLRKSKHAIGMAGNIRTDFHIKKHH